MTKLLGYLIGVLIVSASYVRELVPFAPDLADVETPCDNGWITKTAAWQAQDDALWDDVLRKFDD